MGTRCAILVADVGAEGPLPEEAWRPCPEALLAAARRGWLAAGLQAPLQALGGVLRVQLPARPEDRDEVPGRSVLL